MKRGDLVQIMNMWLKPGESDFGIFWDDSLNTGEWGHISNSDCIVIWNGKFTPFSRDENLILISEIE